MNDAEFKQLRTDLLRLETCVTSLNLLGFLKRLEEALPVGAVFDPEAFRHGETGLKIWQQKAQAALAFQNAMRGILAATLKG